MVSVASITMALTPFLLSVVSDAHSWIDCIDTDRSKIYDQSESYIFGGAGGNGFCQGYGAGYPGRGDGDIGPGYTYKMLKNEVEAGAPVCQDVGDTYKDWRTRITLAPGQTAYFAYLPNGHIVKDKKGVGTQHGVYWTGQTGSSLSTTLDMTPDHLIDGHTMDYDDGNCGETTDTDGVPSGRAGDGKPCIGSFTIPAGTPPGIYNMVWYWTFWLENKAAYVDQEQASGYFGAAYSTCFDVEVTGDGNDVTQSDVTQTGATPEQTEAPEPAPEPDVAPESAYHPDQNPLQGPVEDPVESAPYPDQNPFQGPVEDPVESYPDPDQNPFQGPVEDPVESYPDPDQNPFQGPVEDPVESYPDPDQNPFQGPVEDPVESYPDPDQNPFQGPVEDPVESAPHPDQNPFQGPVYDPEQDAVTPAPSRPLQSPTGLYDEIPTKIAASYPEADFGPPDKSDKENRLKVVGTVHPAHQKKLSQNNDSGNGFDKNVVQSPGQNTDPSDTSKDSHNVDPLQVDAAASSTTGSAPNALMPYSSASYIKTSGRLLILGVALLFATTW